MITMTFNLLDDRKQEPGEINDRFGIAAEDLARFNVERLPAGPKEAFQHITGYVPNKNSELCNRLS